MTWNFSACFAAAVLAAATPWAAAAPPPLLFAAEVGTRPGVTGVAPLEMRDGTAPGTLVGRLNLLEVGRAGAAVLAIPGHGPVTFEGLAVGSVEGGLMQLSGVAPDFRSHAFVTSDADGSLGYLSHRGQLYRVRPLGGGLSRISINDDPAPAVHPLGWNPHGDPGPAGLPPDGASVEPLSQAATHLSFASRRPAVARVPSTAPPRIRLLYAVTPGARATAGRSVDGIASHITARLNDVFGQSGVAVRFEAAHVEPLDASRARYDSIPLRDVLLEAGRWLLGIEDQVRATGADLALLVVDSASPQVCGVAVVPTLADLVGGLHYDFAVIDADCELYRGGTTAAHEIGHIAGAHHAIDQPDSPGRNFLWPWGHGWCGPGFATVMAYERSKCPVGIPRFSSREVRADAGIGEAEFVGTWTSDVVRLLNDRLPELAGATPDDETAGRYVEALPFVPRADAFRQGFLRIASYARETLRVRIDAWDDTGAAHGPVWVSVPPGEVRGVTSDDLEQGGRNVEGRLGRLPSGRGHWRLRLTAPGSFAASAYVRYRGGEFEGFLSVIGRPASHPVLCWASAYCYSLYLVNPGRNRSSVGIVRIANLGSAVAEVGVRLRDDAGYLYPGSGYYPAGQVPAGGALTLSAASMEERFGITPRGKWRVSVVADQPLAVHSFLLQSATGALSDLTD